MLELVTFVFIFSVFFAILISFGLFVFRIVLVIKEKRTVLESLLIILLPGGTGYLHFYNKNTKHKHWYSRLVLIMFVFIVIGSIYIAFLNIPEFAHWFFYGS